jgi:membrane protein implicated in regulation of membrane protease activity
MGEIYIYFWLAIMVGLIIFEAMTAQIVALWFIGGSLVALILAIFNVHIAIQIAAFLIVSIALMICINPILKKLNKNKELKTNAEELTEEVGLVVKDIPTDDIGEVKVKYQIWNAISENNEPIEKGKKVSILKIEGNKLVVKEKE